ncbi:hypothetical protein [Streptomyces sp. WAC 06738]|uniref:hypothetical protein n=1 Tax=Streptomyces sp. WAC 06738 TaxID=2203210 RepID=UPI001F0CB19F|nr:hypothetical protein [Streptomyces sp. WAC 06738]
MPRSATASSYTSVPLPASISSTAFSTRAASPASFISSRCPTAPTASRAWWASPGHSNPCSQSACSLVVTRIRSPSPSRPRTTSASVPGSPAKSSPFASGTSTTLIGSPVSSIRAAIARCRASSTAPV